MVYETTQKPKHDAKHDAPLCRFTYLVDKQGWMRMVKRPVEKEHLPKALSQHLALQQRLPQ
jgi:hypothetical protein